MSAVEPEQPRRDFTALVSGVSWHFSAAVCVFWDEMVSKKSLRLVEIAHCRHWLFSVVASGPVLYEQMSNTPRPTEQSADLI